VTGAYLSKLAGRASDAVIVTFDAGRRVEDRTKPATRIMPSLKLGLIESKGIARRLRNSVAYTLRTWLSSKHACGPNRLPERRSSEPGGRFPGFSLSNGAKC
jgi:hypothetical protein